MSTTPNSTFKFRAETTVDVWKFLVRLYERGMFFVKNLNLSHGEPEPGIHDACVVEMEVFKVNPQHRMGQPYHVAATLEELRAAAADIVDCHVIHESLNYADQYDGERYYTPWMSNPEYKHGDREVKSYSVASRFNTKPPQGEPPTLE